MKRDPAALADGRFDLLVIGGGVIGACIVRDAARRGMKAALAEQNDFGSAASEAMSHTLHGGIRYLSTGQFGVVRQGLRERAMWQRTAPSFATEQDWLLPLTNGRRALQNRAGAALYQWLSGRRAKTLSAKDALAVEPALDFPGLSGAAVYQDFHLADPHGLVMAILNDAAAHGAVIANHVSVEGRVADKGSQAVVAVDALSGERIAVRADALINATGPWAQHVADRLVPGQKAVRLTGSKGIHLVTPQLASGNAIAVSGRGEHIFCIPWQGYSLFGTTDDAYGGDPASVAPMPGEVDALRAKALRLLPSARTVLDRIVGSFAGVRALPGVGSNTYRAVRESLVTSHAADGAPSVWTAAGGKWTTARQMAEKAVDLAVAQSGKRFDRCTTANAGIAARPMAQTLEGRLAQAAKTEMAVTAVDLMRRLGRAALLADPGLPAAVDSWLARRAREEDSAPGRSGRL